MKLWLTVGAAVLAAGCLHPNAETCADGRVCPDGRACYATAAGEKLCLTPDQLTTCKALDDGEDCTIDMRDPGFCKDHVCLPGACGDGFRRGDEQCDGTELGPASEADCINYGYYYSKAPTCSAGCSYDLSGCVGTCGDKTVDVGFEFCDTDPPARSCKDLGYGVGYLGCSDDCGPGLEECRLFGWDPPGVTLPTEDMFDVHGVDDGRVFAVGLQGALYRYDGANWSPVDLSSCIDPATFSAYAVWVFEDSVFVGGTDGVVLRVTSTGCAMSRAGGDGVAITDLWAASDTDIYAVTTTSVVHFDGTAWSTSTAMTGLTHLWGSGPDSVYAAGGTSVIRRTGGSWNTVGAGPFSSVTSIWGGSAGDVYVGGLETTSNNPLIRHYDGASWSTLPAPPGVTSIDAGGVSFGRVFVAGAGSVAHVFDFDGSTWIDLGWTTTSLIAKGLWLSPAGALYLTVLGKNRVYRFPGSDSDDTTIAAGQIRRITARSAHEAYAVYDDGVGAAGGDIYAWDGNVWSADSGGITTSVVDVSIAPDSSTYMLQGGNLRLRTGQSAWQTEVAVAGGRLFAAGLDDVWVAFNGGTGSTLTHWNGTTLSSPVTLPYNILSLGGSSPSNIYAVGNNSLLAHYDGVSWTTLSSPTVMGNWTGVTMCGTHVVVVGTFGTVAETDDSTTWTMSKLPVSVNPQAVWCSAPNDILVGAVSGFMYWFNGTHWSPVKSSTSQEVDTVAGAGDMLFFGDVTGAIHRVIRATQW